jgi:hypothetical protein
MSSTTCLRIDMLLHSASSGFSGNIYPSHHFEICYIARAILRYLMLTEWFNNCHQADSRFPLSRSVFLRHAEGSLPSLNWSSLSFSSFNVTSAPAYICNLGRSSRSCVDAADLSNFFIFFPIFLLKGFSSRSRSPACFTCSKPRKEGYHQAGWQVACRWVRPKSVPCRGQS